MYNFIKDCCGVVDILELGNVNLDINNVMCLSVFYLMLYLICLFLYSIKKIIVFKIIIVLYF